MPVENADAVEARLSHLFVAFGQGAGPIFMTVEAVQAARDQYRPLVQGRLSEWDSNALVLFEYARSLGRTAANIAAQQGSPQIDAAHYREASSRVASASASTRIACPFC